MDPANNPNSKKKTKKKDGKFPSKNIKHNPNAESARARRTNNADGE